MAAGWGGNFGTPVAAHGAIGVAPTRRFLRELSRCLGLEATSPNEADFSPWGAPAALVFAS